MDKKRAGGFHTNPQNILMEIKGNLMLKRPRPLRHQPNLETRINTVNIMKTPGIQLLNVKSTKKLSTNWLTRSNLIIF